MPNTLPDSIQTANQLIKMVFDTTHVVLLQPQSNSHNTELLSLIIALVAVIVGPIVQLYINKKQITAQIQCAMNQIKSTTLSSNRQQWINDLRDNISEFCNSLMFLTASLNANEVSTKEWFDRLDKLNFIHIKIGLQLNPNEEDHKSLLTLLDSVYRSINEKDKEQVKQKMTIIMVLTQKILKTEWERVKKLD